MLHPLCQSLANNIEDKNLQHLHRGDECEQVDEMEVHRELDQAVILREMRTLEVNLAEEKRRSKDNEEIFSAELEDQRQAHTRDILELENMVKHVLAENKRLSSIVAAWEKKERAGSSSCSGTPKTISSTSSVSSRRGRIQETESSTSASTSSLPRTPELNGKTPSVCCGSDTDLALSDDGISSVSD